jgi:hypothetical protein
LPVTKISMSESKGRYNLFTNKNNVQALMDYMAHLLKVIPKWLDKNVNYTGGKILANTTAATQYARVQPKSNLTQPQPALTAPKQTKPNPLATVSSQQSITLEIDSSKNPLIPVINQLKNQITTLQATVNSQSGIMAQLIQNNKTSSTMASTLPSQLKSVISRVDSSITTASESYKAHMDDISIRMTIQLHDMHQVHLEQTKIANTEPLLEMSASCRGFFPPKTTDMPTCRRNVADTT